MLVTDLSEPVPVVLLGVVLILMNHAILTKQMEIFTQILACSHIRTCSLFPACVLDT